MDKEYSPKLYEAINWYNTCTDNAKVIVNESLWISNIHDLTVDIENGNFTIGEGCTEAWIDINHVYTLKFLLYDHTMYNFDLTKVAYLSNDNKLIWGAEIND